MNFNIDIEKRDKIVKWSKNICLALYISWSLMSSWIYVLSNHGLTFCLVVAFCKLIFNYQFRFQDIISFKNWRYYCMHGVIIEYISLCLI